MKDLFNHYQDQPEPLKKICDKWQQKLETDGLDYKDCKSFLNEVEKIGFTFDYGLSAEPFNLRKIEPTNLNMLFVDLIRNFVHLITPEEQTKEAFLDTIKRNYDISNPRTQMFYQACQKSIFNTIRLNRTKDNILFNR
jgi:hypothetical protein